MYGFTQTSPSLGACLFYMRLLNLYSMQKSVISFSVILYGIGLFGLLWLLKTLEWHFLVKRHSFDIYAGMIALVFTALGIWTARKLFTTSPAPKTETTTEESTIVPNSSSPSLFVCDDEKLKVLGISKRELEVLQLMAEGLSNQEIADRLFVSLNTIKTHISRLLEKLGASRRTQAIQKAREFSIIP